MEQKTDPSPHDNSASIAELVSQVIADPNCHKAGCYGRGYIGVKQFNEGGKSLILCSCAKMGQTDAWRLLKNISSFKPDVEAIFDKRMALLSQDIMMLADGMVTHQRAIAKTENHQRVMNDVICEMLTRLHKATLIGRIGYFCRRMLGKKFSTGGLTGWKFLESSYAGQSAYVLPVVGDVGNELAKPGLSQSQKESV